MRRDLIGHGPHVNLLKDVNARDDEEDARTSSSSCEEPTKPEYHCSFVFLVSSLYILATLDSYLNNFDHDIEGEGEGGKDEEEGADGEEERADAGTLFAN